MKISPHLTVPYLLPYCATAFGFYGIYIGGFGYYCGFLFIYLIHPIMDSLGGHTTTYEGFNKLDEKIAQVILLLSVPIQIFFLIAVFEIISSRSLSALEMFGAIASTGLMTAGLGITAGHELIHRSKWWEKRCGDLLYISVGYPHFPIEHVYGHHKNVATHEDPTSARKDESLYCFWVRSIITEITSGLRLNKNHMYWNFSFLILLCSGIFTLWGLKIVLFFIGQSVFSILMLETINYIQHYGLQRKEVSPGVYERVQYHHSWETSKNITNWFLFNLGRHADHHRYASKHFLGLQPQIGRKVLPAGYSVMFLIALIPPLWRFVMNPKLSH